MKTLNSTQSTLLFVYGTLRDGESNDINQYRPKLRRVGAGRVRGRLYDLGACPAIILNRSADLVLGEVYAVEPSLIPVLDAVEDNCGQYFRMKTDVLMEDGSRLRCILYESGVAQVRGRPLIAGGDWVAHRHALQLAA